MKNSVIRDLRKKYSMTQRELASRLEMRQSFLSAIESGRSKMPVKKMELLRSLFPEVDSPDEQVVDESVKEVAAVDGGVAGVGDANEISRLLTHFHERAHRDGAFGESHLMKRIETLESRNDKLAERNDVLSAQNDSLRAEIDSLRSEIFSLRSGR